MISRIFDIAENRAVAEPDAIMLAAKEQGEWKTYSNFFVWQTAKQLANGLKKILGNFSINNPELQEKVAIISANRPEWIITDIATQLSGAVLTPIYPTISPAELEFILRDAGVKVLFISNAQLYSRFKEMLGQLDTLKFVYSFDDIEQVNSWKDLIKNSTDEKPEVADSITEQTLATIIYTSGTTGNPKGVMLSHKNVVSNVSDSMPAFTFAKLHSRALSFLPLNHIFERTVSYIYINAGIAIYYAENMDTIGQNLKEVKPMVFTTVPRLLEKVYERIVGAGLELKGIKRAIFFWALNLSRKFDNVQQGTLWYRLQLKLADKLVYTKWREGLGNNVKAIVVGSASCQERLIRIFSSAQVVIMEGYGLTETSPVITVNRFESEGRRVGTVGKLIDNVQVKIAEDGEILCKGNNVMMGYYRKPELTADAFTDGWFHTGDIGKWQEGVFLKITDRKKEIFKTSGGKYVAPQVIENKMKESAFIEQMMVIGADRKFVSALIVPSFPHIFRHLKDEHPTVKIPESKAEIIKMPEVLKHIQSVIDRYNQNFSHPEQIKKFALLANEWTIDAGEITPTLKLKRKVIEQHYANEINALYANENPVV